MRELRAVIAAGLVAAAAGGGLAVAAGEPDSIIGCAERKTGDLRIVNRAKKCRRSERVVRFDKAGGEAVGVAGPQGQAGAAGSPGGQGPAGPPGAAAAVPPAAYSEVVGSATLTPVNGSPLTFDVRGFDFRARRPFDPATGQATGPVAYEQLTIVRRLDAASPRLLTLLEEHTTLTVDLAIANSGGMRITASQAMMRQVDGLQPAGGDVVQTIKLRLDDPQVTAGAGVPVPPAPGSAPIGTYGIGGASGDVFDVDFKGTRPEDPAGEATGPVAYSPLAFTTALDGAGASLLQAMIDNANIAGAKLAVAPVEYELTAAGVRDWHASAGTPGAGPRLRVAVSFSQLCEVVAGSPSGCT